MLKFSIICVNLTMLLAVSTEACTGLKLTTRTGQAVHGRTLEFGLPVECIVTFIPRNYSFTANTPLGGGLTYQSKYAAIGISANKVPLLMDGINEKGLSVGTFYFPGFAGYAAVTEENRLSFLSPVDFPNWVVTQFATLEEVKEGLAKVNISPTIIESWGKEPAPFHYIVYDKDGNSLVIEPVNGKLEITENPLGTFTNSPTLNWHLTNLRNFINLSPHNSDSVKLQALNLEPLGQGSGLVGLPGDFTSPSRFVRAALFSLSAETPETVDEAIFQTFHLLNQFDIPKGVVRAKGRDGETELEYTQVTVVHDPGNLKYYFRTYQDQSIKFLELNGFDKEAKEMSTLETSSEQTYTNISKELKFSGKR